MRVLITGGAGFIGSHLAERLLARGDEVVVLDNYVTGRSENLRSHDRLALVEGTVGDESTVDRAFTEHGSFDVAVHAAASYKDPDAWAEDARSNVVGTANVVRASERSGVGRLIYFQTALCYGLHPRQQPITLEHPILPQGSSYAISKTAAEQYISLSGLDWISFRLANVYGPRNRSGPLPTFYSRIARGDDVFVMDTRRDFVYVDDVLGCVLKAIDGVGRRGPYHIASGRDYSIKELYDQVATALGVRDREVAIRPRNSDDAPSILLDPSETERDFGWRVATPLTDGVARTVDDYRQRGIGETFTHLKHFEPAPATARPEGSGG